MSATLDQGGPLQLTQSAHEEKRPCGHGQHGSPHQDQALTAHLPPQAATQEYSRRRRENEECKNQAGPKLTQRTVRKLQSQCKSRRRLMEQDCNQDQNGLLRLADTESRPHEKRGNRNHHRHDDGDGRIGTGTFGFWTVLFQMANDMGNPEQDQLRDNRDQ